MTMYLAEDKALEKQKEILRQELDGIRLKYQVAQIELARYRTLGYFVFKALARVQTTASSCFSYVAMKAKLGLSLIKGGPLFHQTFRPYQTKILHPLRLRRPRITHFIANFKTGGSARLIVDLIERLGHKFDQEIVTRDLPNPPDYLVPKICAYRHLASARRFFSHLQRFRPDMIHVHYWGEGDLAWYDAVFEAAAKWRTPIIENVNTPVDPYISPHIDTYVYVSRYVKERFGFLGTRTLTIYPGSDLTFFSRGERSTFKENCIGMVYRLDGDKLDRSAIDVFIEVVRRRKGTKALVVGGGPLLNQYQDAVNRAGAHDAFRFAGYVSYQDLPFLYEQMSIFVAPVFKESFGQVSIFAMGMEIPVVGFRVGGLEEIVGDQKLLATPGNTHKLAELIIQLLDDPKSRLEIGIRNRQRAAALFSVEKMIKSYDALYTERLSESSRRATFGSGAHEQMEDTGCEALMASR